MSDFFTYEESQLSDRSKAIGCTIAAPDQKDLGTAYLIKKLGENTIVTASISDLAFYIRRGSTTDMQAFSRCYTVYQPDGKIPMLPEHLAEDRLSFVPGHERPAYTVQMVLDPQLNFSSVDIELTAFTNQAALIYQYFTKSAETDKDAALWYEVALGLLKKRRREGALFLNDDLGGFGLDVTGAVTSFNDDAYKAQILEAELDILTNGAVAGYAQHHDIPFLYLNHFSEQQNSINRAKLSSQMINAYRTGNQEAIESLRSELDSIVGPAFYSPRCRGHFGLNLSGYCRFTSPLDHYAALVNQRQLFAHMEDRPYPYKDFELNEFSKEFNREKPEEGRKNALEKAVHTKAAIRAVRNVVTNKSAEPISHGQITTGLRHFATNPGINSVFCDLVLEHMRERKIGQDQLFIILTESPKESEHWETLRKAALNYLTDNVGIGVSVLAFGHSTPNHRWSVRFVDNPESNGFACTIKATVNGKPYRPVKGPARAQKQAAKSAASILFWQHFCEVPFELEQPEPAPAPPSESSVPQKPPEPQEKKTTNAVKISAAGKMAFSILIEFCQAKGIASPVDTYSPPIGPVHRPVFECTLLLAIDQRHEPLSAVAQDSTKKNAKDVAAQNLVEKLQSAGLVRLSR